MSQNCAHPATLPFQLSVWMLLRAWYLLKFLGSVFIYLYYNSRKLADWKCRNSNKVAVTWFVCPFVKLSVMQILQHFGYKTVIMQLFYSSLVWDGVLSEENQQPEF